VTAYLVIQSIVLVLLAVFVVGLLRSHAAILGSLARLGSQLEGTGSSGESGFTEVPAGEELPAEIHDLAGVTPHGDGVEIPLVGSAQLTLIAFLSTTCMTCREFWDAFADPRNAEVVGRGSQVVLVTKGPETEQPDDVAALAPEHLRILMSAGAFEDYGVPYSPYFVLVDGDRSRVVGHGAAASFEELQRLLAKVLAEGGFRPGGQRSRREVLRDLRKARAEAGASE
jgi:hypothetical protein